MTKTKNHRKLVDCLSSYGYDIIKLPEYDYTVPKKLVTYGKCTGVLDVI